MSEIMGKVEERTPYVVVAFQVAHVVFLQNGPTPASFCLFPFFSNTNCAEKNCRLQRDPNSDRRSRRQAR